MRKLPKSMTEGPPLYLLIKMPFFITFRSEEGAESVFRGCLSLEDSSSCVLINKSVSDDRDIENIPWPKCPIISVKSKYGGKYMISKAKPERHMDLCKELNALYTKKNHDYGDSFHQTFMEEGFAMPRIRLADKFNRFKTLSRTKALVDDESIRDTLIDLANYAIMTVLEIDELQNMDKRKL